MVEKFEVPQTSVKKMIEAQKAEYRVGEKIFDLKRYEVGRVDHGSSPGVMETGRVEELEELFRDDSLRMDAFFEIGDFIPYTFLYAEQGQVYGDYTTRSGQDQFLNMDMTITDEIFSTPDWMQKLRQFVALKEKRNFKYDSKVACVRSLEIKNGKPILSIGEGLYSDSFYTNGSDGVSISVSDKERDQLMNKGILNQQEISQLIEQASELEGEYGTGKTLREVIISHYGRLPEFGEQVYNNSLGVAGMVLSRDNEFVFVNRGSQVSVNQGINCTASGAVEFDRDALSRYGLQEALGREIARETNEELGLTGGSLILGSMKKKIELELGIHESQYDLVPVGFIRELSRGGKPECMFLIRYHGTTGDLVESIVKNPHVDKEEIDGEILALPAQKTGSLLATKGVSQFIQHKGVANLALCQAYLKING